MAKKEECKYWAELPMLRDYTATIDKGELTFAELAERRIEVADTIKMLEAQKEEIDAAIQVALIVSEEKGVLFDKFVIDVRQGKSAAKIDGQRLALAGVSADVIEAATVQGTPYSYVMFTDTTPKARPYSQ